MVFSFKSFSFFVSFEQFAGFALWFDCTFDNTINYVTSSSPVPVPRKFNLIYLNIFKRTEWSVLESDAVVLDTRPGINTHWGVILQMFFF